MSIQSAQWRRRWNVFMLVALLLSVCVLSAPLAHATSRDLSPEQTQSASDAPITSTPFYSRTVTFTYSGNNVYLSGCINYACTWAVDDYARLIVTHPGDNTQVEQDFISNTISQQAVNITALFKKSDGTPYLGNNSVTVQLLDTYAPQRGGGALYLYETSTTPPLQTLQLEATSSGTFKIRNPYLNNSMDPVNTLIGSYTYTWEDISIQGRGPAPRFIRSYDSSDTRTGSLGTGWTHSYQVRLIKPTSTTNDIVAVSPEGRADYFTYSSGSYSAHAGIFRSLVKNSDGTYTLKEQDQSSSSYDETGRLIKISDRFGNYSMLTYDSSGQLIAVSDPAGRGNLTFTYTSGKLTGVTDWIGRTVTYGYDSNGRLSTVTDRESKTTTYGYDGTSSRITTITDANGHVAVTNTYDSQGRVATQKDARGLTTGQQTTFSYTTNGDGTKTTVITYPQTSFEPTWNHKEEDTYDTSDRLIKHVSKPVSSSSGWITEEYTYDSNGNRASFKDGRGNTTNFCYDVDYAGSVVSGSRGNLTRRIDPAPSTGANRPVTLFKYDTKNNLIEVISPKGVTSGTSVTCSTNLSSSINTLYANTATYDSTTQTKLLSKSYSFTDPDLGQKTATTKYEYNDSANPGLPTKVISPLGNTTGTPDYTYATTYTYFATGSKAGMLQQVTEPLTGTTTFDYDAVGRKISMVDPMGNVSGATASDHTWQYTYDNEDRARLTKEPAPVSGGSQLITEARYDSVGNKVVDIDPNAQVTRYVYDERDQLKYVNQSTTAWTDPSITPTGVITTEYQYDNLGNLSRVIKAKGNTTYERATDYTFDGLGQMRKEIQYPSWPSTSTTLLTTYSYDLNGNKSSMVDPLNKTTSYSYDNLNRKTNITYNSTSTPNVTFAYDFNNNRTSMVDGTGTTSYSYDEHNQLVSVTSPGSNVVGYRFDLNGNRRKLIYPDSTAVTYSFDKANRLSSLQDWASRSTSYSYFADGKLQKITNFNGTSGEYSYDNARRLTQVWNKYGTNTITQHAYTMDAAGNRTREDAVLTNGYDPGPITSSRQGYITYTYDKLNRLTQESRNLPNPQTVETLNYTYDPVGNRLSKSRVTGITKVTNFTYDKADRILAASGDTSETYSVNANGNITRPDFLGNPTLTYDQANRLLSFNTTASYRYTYDGDGKRTKVEYYLSSWSTVSSYIYDVGQGLPNVLVDSTKKYVWGLGLAYVADSNSLAIDNPYVYHTDGLGSVRAMTDNRTPTVRVQMYEEYDAFGVEGYSNRAVDQTFKYAGEQRDDRSGDTGYIYLRSRYYDSAIGRYLTRDTNFGDTTSPLTLNRYTYVENACPNKVDPSGFASSKKLQCAEGYIESELARQKEVFDSWDRAHLSFIAGSLYTAIQGMPKVGLSEQFRKTLESQHVKCIVYDGKIWDTSSFGNVIFGYQMKRSGYNLNFSLWTGEFDQLAVHFEHDPSDDQEQIKQGHRY